MWGVKEQRPLQEVHFGCILGSDSAEAAVEMEADGGAGAQLRGLARRKRRIGGRPAAAAADGEGNPAAVERRWRRTRSLHCAPDEPGPAQRPEILMATVR